MSHTQNYTYISLAIFFITTYPSPVPNKIRLIFWHLPILRGRKVSGHGAIKKRSMQFSNTQDNFSVTVEDQLTGPRIIVSGQRDA